MSTSQTKESRLSAAEILIAARERIAVPERWTQGNYALDAQGKAAGQHAVAVCWCSLGAVIAEAGRDYILESRCIGLLERFADGYDIVTFNDDPKRTHAEVLAAFDRAIELAKAEAGQ